MVLVATLVQTKRKNRRPKQQNTFQKTCFSIKQRRVVTVFLPLFDPETAGPRWAGLAVGLAVQVEPPRHREPALGGLGLGAAEADQATEPPSRTCCVLR